ncbi:EcsC family protein [Clostridium arbusti]|uniref:EcsC family protein n=1 Tax=Clostridium arbusti TaxID=1137848 RepID=UPI000287E2C3|nr:EcsC family protein [Clostridium arbusti]
MNRYEDNAVKELMNWQKEMMKKSGIIENFTKGTQNKINNIIPDKVHTIITEAIKNMIKAVLVGSEYTTSLPLKDGSLEDRENMIREKIDFYKKSAAVSGAGTGGAGFLLSLADFPILLSLKMKFLFQCASLYGFDVKDYRERLYILYIFQLAFSSQKKRNETFNIVKNWDDYSKTLPIDKEAFDWREFQQEYRDYMDIAKLLQMVPGIGAVVGAYANYKLMNQLGKTAMNGYRLRIFKFK